MYIIIKSEDKSIHLIDGKTENFHEYLRNKTWYEIALKDYDFCEFGKVITKKIVSFPIGVDEDDGFSRLIVRFEDLDLTYEYINRMKRSFIKTNGSRLNNIHRLRKSVYMSNIDSPALSSHEELRSSILKIIESYYYIFPYKEKESYNELNSDN